MNSIPFCVLERPFMLWGDDLAIDNVHFLERIDAALYYRTAHNLLSGSGTPAGDDQGTDDQEREDEDRKDVSSLSRLLWHHGIETLVMMLGAYMQAPTVAHAYFLKCKTEDAVSLARLLLDERRPRYSKLSGTPFTLVNLLNGIHLCAGWADRDVIVERFARALRGMLRAYADEEHRWEYNSIKHGLRASHGRFGLAIGIQEAPGIMAPPEAMEMVGFSRDASFFDVAKPLRNATKQASKVHFLTDKVSVAWSLEKVICELQLLSLLLHNTISALRIAGGAAASTLTFNKVADDEEFWKVYFGLHAGNVPTATMTIDIDARGMRLPTEKQILDSYKTS